MTNENILYIVAEIDYQTSLKKRHKENLIEQHNVRNCYDILRPSTSDIQHSDSQFETKYYILTVCVNKKNVVKYLSECEESRNIVIYPIKEEQFDTDLELEINRANWQKGCLTKKEFLEQIVPVATKKLKIK